MSSRNESSSYASTPYSYLPSNTNMLKQENQMELSTKTLFIGDLSYFCTEDDLVNIFSRYGVITGVKIRRGATGESLLYGFMCFQSPESTIIAMRELNGKVFMGRNIR